MGFYGLYLLYLFLGLLFSGCLFYWAVVNGQFREQQRARYLPLGAEEPEAQSARTARWPRSMIVTVLFLAAILAGSLGALLIMALAR